jgi:hypothetical protein
MQAISSASITSSPLYRLDIINKLLEAPNLTPDKRAQFLSAKLDILTNNTISDASSSVHIYKDHIDVLRIRINLAAAYMEHIPPKLVEAESELTNVENQCKKAMRFGPPGGTHARHRPAESEDVEEKMAYNREIHRSRVEGLRL